MTDHEARSSAEEVVRGHHASGQWRLTAQRDGDRIEFTMTLEGAEVPKFGHGMPLVKSQVPLGKPRAYLWPLSDVGEKSAWQIVWGTVGDGVARVAAQTMGHQRHEAAVGRSRGLGVGAFVAFVPGDETPNKVEALDADGQRVAQADIKFIRLPHHEP